MYVINNMNFYVKISNVVDGDVNTAKKVEYVVDINEATQYKNMSDAAIAAEEMSISGFTVELFSAKSSRT